MDDADHDDQESDDIRHLKLALNAISDDLSFKRMTDAVNLLGDGLELIPRCPWPDVFPNDLAATACLGRAYRQLRAAVTLIMSGYYTEARVVLRSTYEFATAARMLAKDPQRAEQWIRKQRWFPDKEVRGWFATRANATGTAQEIQASYSRAYRELTKWVHPTAISCVRILPVEEWGPNLDLSTTFNTDEFQAGIAEVAVTAIFSCFAFKNAAVSEKAIDVHWRSKLTDLARQILASDMPHLERDWDEERRQYDLLQQRIQSVAELDDNLRANPRSWDNLQGSSADPEAQSG